MKLLLAFLLLFAGAVSPEPRYFRYERSLQKLPAQAAQTCFDVSPQIFQHAAPGLADLRLYGGPSVASAETPYTIQTYTNSEIVKQPIIPINRGTRHGQTVFDAVLSGGAYSDLDLDIAAQNFIATVYVSGSQEGSNAETEIGSYTIFDFTSQHLGRSTILHLPESNFPHLHFRIDGALAPDTINSVSVESLPARRPEFLTILKAQSIVPKPHVTEIQFQLPAHTPIDRITFNVGPQPALFSRDVSVAALPANSPDAGPQSQDGLQPSTFSGKLLRIHTEQNGHRIDEERLSLDVQSEGFEVTTNWKIDIQNGDDSPLSLNTVQVEMVARKVCFESAANTGYTLFYGDSALSSPRYDYAKLYRPVVNTSAVQAAAEEPNPNYEPRPDQRPFTEKHPALLWAVLIAVIGLLAWIAIQSMRKIGATPS